MYVCGARGRAPEIAAFDMTTVSTVLTRLSRISALGATVFDRTFKDLGCLRRSVTDIGLPFAFGYALYRLSKLSVWWLRLGIQLERIQPGHPQQNGRHEPMHFTLKQEA